MISSNSIRVLLAAGAVALVAGGANAATVVSCNTPEGDVTDYVTPTSSCFGLEDLDDGSGAKLAELNLLNINGTTGGWATLGKFENTGSNANFSVDDSLVDNQAGLWELFAAATSMYGEFMMIFKAGQDGNTSPAAFVAYILDGTSGTWESPMLVEDSEGRQRNLSNVELYGRSAPAPVPLPAAGWLLLAGIGSLAAMRRRRRAA